MTDRQEGRITMSKDNYLFTSESVSEGHPDKVADRISDEILDGILARDANSRVAVETMVTTDYCLIAGEVTGPEVDFAALARKAIREIGYAGPGFNPATLKVDVRVHAQSHEIAGAVDADANLGAGDQGIMFGFACNETPSLMPAPIHYAHRIVEHLAARRHASLAQLGPDAKSQVTVEYHDGHPARAHTIVVSHMHAAGLTNTDLEEIVRTSLVAVLPPGWLDASTRVLVNPSGSFVHGGPAADTGLTGRKIIVDTYGGAAPHGGGAFSGKDPTKVDRSAAYAARHLAKNIVAAGLAGRCLIQLAYAIGIAEPLAVYVDTQSTGRVADERIEAAIRETVPLTPRAIRDRLGLCRPIYARTAAYGHFGREPEEDGGFSWERVDLVEALKVAIG
jgi:S-adenosylmethionine synthetase